MRCSCGLKMHTHTVQGRGRDTYHYYVCRERKDRGSLAACDQKAIKVSDVEPVIWQSIRALMREPETIRKGWDAMIEQESAGLRGDPDKERKAWLQRIADLDSQRARAQDLAIEGLLDRDELRAKLSEIAEAKEHAQRELESLQERKDHIEHLERLRDL